MAITLYADPGSPPCQAVRLTADLLGVKLDIKNIDLAKNDQMKPEFLALNPLHVVPTLVDGDLVQWESRTICKYLVLKYGGANNPLYPKDLEKQISVDRMCFFDISVVYRYYSDYYYPQCFENKKADPEKEVKMREAFNQFKVVLGKQKFLTGDDLTIADIGIFVTFNVILISNTFPLKKDYPEISAYTQRVADSIPTFKRQEAQMAADIKHGFNFKN